MKRGHLLIAAALGAALNPLNSTMIAVALPAIGRDFGTTAPTVTLLVVTGYLIATLACQMPAGSVADRMGYGRALTIGRAIFAAGAAAGAFAPTLSMVVIGRLLMAAGGSLMVPTSMALVRIAIPAERRARAFGTLGAVMGVAAAIGPALGGWIAPILGWRWLFAINLPVIGASWLLQGPVHASAHTNTGTRPFDWAGSLLSAATLVLLASSTRMHGAAFYAAVAAACAMLVVLLMVERRVEAPVLDLDLFGRPVFAAAAGIIAAQNLTMYSLLVMVPFLFNAAGSATVGLAIVAMTATMAATAPVGGWIAERIGIRPVVFAGGVIGAAGVIAIARASMGAAAPMTVLSLAVRLFPVGLGLGLSTGPTQAAGLSVAPAAKSGLASASLSMVRYVGSIAGTVVLATTMGGGATAERQGLWIFAGSFALSAVLALCLTSPERRVEEEPRSASVSGAYSG